MARTKVSGTISLLSLAENIPATEKTFDLQALDESFVKALVLGDDENEKDEKVSTSRVTEQQWSDLTRQFNTKTRRNLDTPDFHIKASEDLNHHQIKALVKARMDVRQTLSQISYPKASETKREAEANVREAWWFATDPSVPFWDAHLSSARTKKDAWLEMEAFDHIKGIFQSFTRTDSENFFGCRSDHGEATTEHLPVFLRSQTFYNSLLSTWAKNLREDVRSSTGVDIVHAPRKQSIAVLRSYEGLRATHVATSNTLCTWLDFGKLSKYQSPRYDTGGADSASQLLEVKWEEMATLKGAGKISNY